MRFLWKFSIHMLFAMFYLLLKNFENLLGHVLTIVFPSQRWSIYINQNWCQQLCQKWSIYTLHNKSFWKHWPLEATIDFLSNLQQAFLALASIFHLQLVKLNALPWIFCSLSRIQVELIAEASIIASNANSIIKWITGNPILHYFPNTAHRYFSMKVPIHVYHYTYISLPTVRFHKLTVDMPVYIYNVINAAPTR